MSKNNIFCHAPWTNIEILPNGDILPCCKFQNSSYNEKFNIQNNTVKEFRQSDFLREIKREFEQNVWPSGCARCRIEEEIGTKSKRLLDFERWEDSYKKYNFLDDNILTISLAIGNTCNLKCIMCSPHASSLWKTEYENIYKISIDNINSIRKDAIHDLINFAPNLVHIDFHGGEPFLSNVEYQLKIFDYYIQQGRAKDISIHYTTNGTIFPDDRFWERFSFFKHVDIQLSIDGIRKRYEYIRFPAKWDTLEQHVLKFLNTQKNMPNLQLSVAHTLTAFNVYYLEEFYKWCSEIGLPDPWVGRLHRPDHLRATVWPRQVRQIIIDKLKLAEIFNFCSWIDLLSEFDDSIKFEDFKKFVSTHDNYRKTHFSHTFPELAPFIL